MTRILVTGGSGFLGRRLQKRYPEWLFTADRNTPDLRNYESTYWFFNYFKPDAVLHLASEVGGIKKNVEHQADFFENNTEINLNVLKACRQVGIPRVVSALSTCVFPDIVENYPFTEKDMLTGPPQVTNLAYAFTKRALYIQTLAYRTQYGLNYSCFCPSNLYGPGDHFDSEDSHFVAALVSKLHKAKDGERVDFWGTGEELRQQLYVDDLVEIIPFLVSEHHSSLPLIVAPDENLSILEMVYVAARAMNKTIVPHFSGELSGQYRKDGSNKALKELLPGVKFTSFETGIKKTYEHYKETTKC